MISKEKLKELSKLKTKKGRSKERKFLIEGLRLCEEAAKSGWPIESVLFTTSFEQKTRGKKLLRKLQKLNADLIPAKSQILAKLSETVTAQGIICVAETRRLPVKDLWERNLKLNVALDGIRDPGNVGTLIRTADAFGIDGMILSGDTVELFNPKVVRSTMGSIFRLKIVDDVDLQKTVIQLKKRRFKIIGTDVKQGKRIEKLNLSGRTCLLIGSEAEGLSSKLLKLSDGIVRIPTCDKAESLNVAVAGGILLYEMTKKRISGRIPR
jgi:TrmH family RNA methyltransferase